MSGNGSIVIIGGTSGVGEAVARHYARRGRHVVITGRDRERAAAAARAIGEGVEALAVDLAEAATIAPALAGIKRVDGLVIVAVERDFNAARDYRIAAAQRLVTLKLVGYTEVVHTLFGRMSAEASVVLFGGLAKDRPYPGSTTVTTVNGGVASLIRTLAVELAPIRFNAVHPGIIADSPAWKDKREVIAAVEARTPGGRLATTADIVSAVDFLLSNRGVNGVNLAVDGGWLLM